MSTANLPFRAALPGLLALAMLWIAQSRADGEGVPRRDPDYAMTVDQWWATHPFNPESSEYAPRIASPSPVRRLREGDDIQQAIDALPPSGGTIELGPGSYAGFLIVGRSNVHVVAETGAIIRGTVRLATSREALEYGSYDAAVSRSPRHDRRVREEYKHPARNFYFRNVVFDGENRLAGLVVLQRVYDVVFDDCTFQNGVNPRAHHPGQLSGHEGLNNIWCRNCRFLGACVYASYLGGCHGSGMIGCTVELSRFHSGGFLYLTNDDFTEDINENGQIDREEERSAKYIVIYKNTFHGDRAGAVQVTGEDVLVAENTATGSLTSFVGSDPRWADCDHRLAYHFYNFMIVGNHVHRCSEALFLMRNAAPLGVPRECEVPRMGRFVIRDNVIGSCPRLVKAVTLGLPPRRDAAVASGTASFDGPNRAENNTSGGKPIAATLEILADALGD